MDHSFLVSSLNNLGPRQQINDQKNYKEKKQGRENLFTCNTKAIGKQVLTPFESYTCLLEEAKLINQRPIGRVPNDPDDGSYLSPKDQLLGRASTTLSTARAVRLKNPKSTTQSRVGFGKIVDNFWRRWTRDVFPSLVLRKKGNVEKRRGQITQWLFKILILFMHRQNH